MSRSDGNRDERDDPMDTMLKKSSIVIIVSS
jgi:hypothetical protein